MSEPLKKTKSGIKTTPIKEVPLKKINKKIGKESKIDLKIILKKLPEFRDNKNVEK